MGLGLFIGGSPTNYLLVWLPLIMSIHFIDDTSGVSRREGGRGKEKENKEDRGGITKK